MANHLAAQIFAAQGCQEDAIKHVLQAGVEPHKDSDLLKWHAVSARILIDGGRFDDALEHLKRLSYVDDGKMKVKELAVLAKKAVKNTELPEEEVQGILEEFDNVRGDTSFFKRLKEGLSKSRKGIGEKIEIRLNQLGDAALEEIEERIEEVLIEADVGVSTTRRLLSVVSKAKERGDVKGTKGIIYLIRNEMVAMLKRAEHRFQVGPERPFFITVVGVNGTGKTTTIAKLTNMLSKEGYSVLLAAGDTFRAAGSQQLEEWGRRLGMDTLSQLHGSDPSGVAYDAARAGVSRKKDVVILDTAGRLHTKVNLMEELKKVERVVSKEIPGAPHATLLVLDATTGQNALSQAKTFSEAVRVTGIVLTKLDGTAKGGIVLATANELSLPIFYIGVGEGLEDLQPFEAEGFVDAIFEED
jgi:fused signal recognition particle receptor